MKRQRDHSKNPSSLEASRVRSVRSVNSQPQGSEESAKPETESQEVLGKDVVVWYGAPVENVTFPSLSLLKGSPAC